MRQTHTVSAKKIGRKGQQIYERLRPKLESSYAGKIVAIDVESGDYFVGGTLHEAIEKGRKKYPERVFYSVRVGSPAVYSFSNRATIAGPATTTTL